MNPSEIIQQYNLHEAKESSLTRPEAIPLSLVNLFKDHHEVQAYTSDNHLVWMLVSRAEHRLVLEAPTK
jgi:hypothetical protein